jgi:hypothetical protein
MNNNKLIAEFMGWDIKSPTTIPSNLHLSNLELDSGEFWAYEFHTSWNWLMPVVNKCYTSNMQHPNDDITQGLIDVDIKATYQAVVEFIKEYNNEI